MSFKETTRGIAVNVEPTYLEEQSDPNEELFVWSYQVKLENTSDETVRLLNRYWKIIDADGRVQEVEGPGVIGMQPELEPGEVFEYASGTYLPTESGIMAGHYEMINQDGDHFNIAVPAFSLDSPDQRRMVN